MNNRQQFFLGKYFFINFLILFFLSVNILSAQSGRRGAKPAQTPAPEAAQPEPTPEKSSKPDLKALYKLKVFSNSNSLALSRFFYREKVPFWVVERLKNSALLDVSSGSDVSQSEAKKIAKNTTDDTFTVFVALDEDQFISPSQSRSNSINGNISIKYYVYEPQTGKTKHSGQIILYPEMVSINRGVLDAKRMCYPQVSGNDVLLLYSSIETAERIMSNLKIPIPVYKCASKI